MRRPTTTNDALACELLSLHRDCGSDTGVGNSFDDEPVPVDRRSSADCETTQCIAVRFAGEYPRNSSSDDT